MARWCKRAGERVNDWAILLYNDTENEEASVDGEFTNCDCHCGWANGWCRDGDDVMADDGIAGPAATGWHSKIQMYKPLCLNVMSKSPRT